MTKAKFRGWWASPDGPPWRHSLERQDKTLRGATANSQAPVRYKKTDYSVPVAYAHLDVIVKTYFDDEVITAVSDEIARHQRSYLAGDFVFDPSHYLAPLEEKVGALDQAAPLQVWPLPTEFAMLRRLLEARLSQEDRCAVGK